MIDLATFYPRITPFVTGAPTPLVNQAIVDSAIAFCEKSLAIKQLQTTQNTVANQKTYAFPTFVDQEVSRITRAWVNGAEIPLAAIDEVDQLNTTKSQPRTVYVTRTDSVSQFNFYPTPDAAYSYVLEVALRPSRTAKTLQDDLFNLWVEPIAEGALGRIMGVAGQSYTNIPLSVQKLSYAQALSNRGTIDAGTGRVQASRRIKFNSFT